MKLKNLLTAFPIFTGAVAAALVCAVITAFTGPVWLTVTEFVLIGAVCLLVYLFYGKINQEKQKFISEISSDLDFLGGNVTEDFPLPVVICSKDGKVIWFNKTFDEAVIGSGSSGYTELTSMFNDIGMDTLLNAASSGMSLDCDGKNYTVFSHKAKKNDEDVIIMYLIDTTRYRKIADEFIKTRPEIVILTIDNMAELQQDFKESDCSAIRNGIEKLIEIWVKDYPCLLSRVSDGKFYIVTEKQHVDAMIDSKFDILDSVREYTYDDKYIGATLSIGAGSGATFADCEKNAKLAIDMALGRGGDQAVIKTKENYSFFGGVSKSVESVNKVKSRVVASALAELIKGSENIIVMGHRFPDFDAMGAAFGVVCIAKSLGKNAYIATNPDASMSKPLLEAAEQSEFSENVISVDEAKEKMAETRKNLLIVVDTHIRNFVESTELLNEAKMVVVIDHHRKAVDYIDNAVIFFHDPSASSASEMVTELVEYIPATTQLGSFAADALMSGIMLDTKNFILRSTARTFEAAAYLKSQGADTVRVKKFFANDIDSYHTRNKIISDARKYRNCAVAVADVHEGDLRMLSAQAADELLNISGVDASFVIFSLDDVICVSARSLGAVNVQVFMEELGGGGHQTMAATQIKNSTIEKVTENVMRGIDKYNENTKKKR